MTRVATADGVVWFKECAPGVNGQRDFPVGGQLISLLADT